MNRASSATGWVRNPDGSLGYTCSSKTGCLNDCPYCYARKLANGRLRERYLANDEYAPIDITNLDMLGPADDSFYPRFWPERLEQIRKRKKPVGIFLNDMSDWMGEYWPQEWTEMELQVMRDCPQHRFYTLTKQPQNLIKFSPFPDNCWVGVTATDGTAIQRAVIKLKQVVAPVRFISFEPLLRYPALPNNFPKAVDWVIIGAQTKPAVYPHIKWVQEIVEAADKAGIPVFLKDNLKPLFFKHITVNDKWALSKKLGRGELYRQELPK